MSHFDTDPKSPPPVRIGALGLFLDETGRVLVVRPTYKEEGQNFYQLPGGAAGLGESDWDAAAREVLEETGLDLVPLQLLVKDFMPAKPGGAAAGHNFVRYFGELPHDTPITLPDSQDGKKPELDDYQWVAEADLDKFCAPYQARRIREALAALAGDYVAELNYGFPSGHGPATAT